jgi:uncharacterized ferritin-like protein (DUF455 family)
MALIDRRLGELMTNPVLVPSSRDFAKRLAHYLGHLDDSSALSGLRLALNAIVRDTETRLQFVDPDWDEPTRFLLLALRSEFQEITTEKRQDCAPLLNLGPIELSLERWERSSLRSVDTPGRAGHLRYDPVPAVRHSSDRELVRDPELFARFLFFVWIDIEIGAAEVCAKSILDGQDLPTAFAIDLSRQIWDEARHAAIIRRRMDEVGVQETRYTYSLCVWRKYHLGRSLAERIAIQHVVQEGNGFEDTISFLQELREVDDSQTAEAFEFILADEAEHVRLGNRWLRHLMGGSDSAYADCVVKAANLIKTSIPRTKLNRSARLGVGFSENFLDWIAPSP